MESKRSINLPNHKLTRYLVIYLGAIQALHGLLLILALRVFLKGEGLGILVRAPVAGWSAVEEFTLIILGGIDLVLVVGCLIFVVNYFKNMQASLQLGRNLLTAFHISAFVYGLIILTSGAGWEHPLFYLGMLVLFLPISLLLYKLTRELRRK